jgi:hypothetical protein
LDWLAAVAANYVEEILDSFRNIYLRPAWPHLPHDACSLEFTVSLFDEKDLAAGSRTNGSI